MADFSFEELAPAEAEAQLASQREDLGEDFDRWTPVHAPACLALWERALGAASQCRIVVAWDGKGEMAAYAPLMRVRGKFGPVPVSTLRFIGNNVGYPGDILYSEVFARSKERTAVHAVLRHVAATWSPGKWELGYLPTSSRTWYAASRILGRGFAPPGSRASVPFVSVDLPDEWARYCASLASNTRRLYRSGMRRLDAQGTVRTVFETTPAAVRRRVGELIANHQRWLAGTAKEEWLGDEKVHRFHLASAQLLSEEGHFVSSTLELGGKPIAWIVGPAHRRTLYAHLSSYDRTFSEDSPGLVLGLELMRELIRRGFRRVELGPGRTLYKRRLGGTETPYLEAQGYQGWARSVAFARGLARNRSGQ